MLVGNGLNWAGQGPSWSELLDDLRQVTGYDDTLDEATPFPLLYEELYLKGLASGVSEETLLAAVASHAERIPVTPLLCRLAKLDVRHLLTTNYDAATEMAFLGGLGVASAPVTETRYSLFRRRERAQRVLWPIHGEGRNPNSIMLGYDHYSGYLERIRRYVTSGVRYRQRSHRSLVKSLGRRGGLDLIRSWVDFFFTKHVVVLGLSLDVEEVHLWWLLTYRARRRAEGRLFASDGRVTFVHPRLLALHEAQGPDDRKRRDRMVRVHRLLQVAGVELVEIPAHSATDRTVYFSAALDALEGIIGSGQAD